jgi:hypothetical protein
VSSLEDDGVADTAPFEVIQRSKQSWRCCASTGTRISKGGGLCRRGSSSKVDTSKQNKNCTLLFFDFKTNSFSRLFSSLIQGVEACRGEEEEALLTLG